MAEVTCPQCSTRQPIDEDASTYRCIVCAATWPNCGTPHGRNRRGMSRRGAPIPLVIAALLAVGVVAVLALSLGDDDAVRSPSPSPPTIEDPANEVCRDVVDVQVFRVDALGRAADDLRDDAAALRAEGAPGRAARVDDV